MTPEDIDWPPPVCEPCRDDRHGLCVRERWCECADCPWIYDEETP